MVYVKNFTAVLLLVLAGSIIMRMVPDTTEVAMASEKGSYHQFTTIHSTEELAAALNNARILNKPVILDVYADWCISCKQMDKEVFANEDVRKTLSNVNLLRLDITRQTKANEDLQKELGIIAPPMILFFGPDGHEVKSYRVAGKTESINFIDRVKHFLQHSGGSTR
jgi:thiol:disulfide interchange protein DsbD